MCEKFLVLKSFKEIVLNIRVKNCVKKSTKICAKRLVLKIQIICVKNVSVKK